MSIDPKNEDGTECIPHVASIAAAYGDPKRKYADFMAKNQANYQSTPFWFYDQAAALPTAKGTHGGKREEKSGQPRVPVSFECPLPTDGTGYELDNDMFVTCDDLKPFYLVPVPGTLTEKETGANI